MTTTEGSGARHRQGLLLMAACRAQNGEAPASGRRGVLRPTMSRPPARDVGGTFSVVGVEAALAVAAEALPRIVPNVLINKREGGPPAHL